MGASVAVTERWPDGSLLIAALDPAIHLLRNNLIAKNRQSLVLGLTELAMLSRMKPDNSSRYAGAAQPSPAPAVSPGVAIGAMIGLVLPTIATWVYFVLAADDPEGVQRAIGLA